MSKIMRLPARLLHRKPDSHKGDFGHVFIIAGSLKFSGAALLCAEGALRTGAGLVTLGLPKGIAGSVIRLKPSEIMLLPLPQTKEGSMSIAAYKKIKDFAKSIDCIALGPGLSAGSSTQVLARKLIATLDVPMVIDADGLNALVGHQAILKKRAPQTTLITPHPGEMARLLSISTKEVQNHRNTIAKKFASVYNLSIILKGAQSAIAGNNQFFINPTGNPGMSTAGSGDVLTGMAAALWAQGLDAFHAAKYAAYLHGLAGDFAAAEKTQMGMVASDIIAKIPAALKKASR